ncbi:MAG: NAD(P)-dependent oxidoreductase [Oscillospiraceae bacterium]|nr:NAD(P)-dependent oxidoreductase [Oscillospiraceae bacterium]
MQADTVFVTGASGCIGGWVVKNLVEEGRRVVALVQDPERLRKLLLIMPADDLAKVEIVIGDLSNLEDVRGCYARGVTKVIHLAALQLPFCKADPVRGARVNVVGTQNIFQAAREAGISQLVYSSSTAVYGRPEEYPGGVFGHESPLKPRSFYGAYKQDNEICAQVWFADEGIASIGIRPFVVYGPLRDQGMTSTPTSAIKAAVRGESYHISYGGAAEFQYADDTAKAFILAADAPARGARCFNLGGGTVSMERIISAIEEACPAARGKITCEPTPLPFPRHNDTGELEKAVGKISWTPLEQGIAQSAEIFRRQLP